MNEEVKQTEAEQRQLELDKQAAAERREAGAKRTRRVNGILKKGVTVVGGFAVIIFIILQLVDQFSFDKAFYKRVYTELGTAETIGISEADLEEATAVLLDYIRDDRDDLDVEVRLADGRVEPMYNAREIAHMIDVKVLYQRAMLVKWTALGIAILAVAVVMRRFGLKRGLGHLARGYRVSLLVFGAFVLVLGAFAFLDFDRFWTQFHLIFFSNDLWILNPATDRMILMVPSYFFNSLVMRIVTGSLVGIVAVPIVLWLLQRLMGERYTGTTDGFG